MVQRVKYMLCKHTGWVQIPRINEKTDTMAPICNFNPPLVRREVEIGEPPETWGLDSSVYTTLNIKDKAEVKDSFSNKVEVKAWY